MINKHAKQNESLQVVFDFSHFLKEIITEMLYLSFSDLFCVTVEITFSILLKFLFLCAFLLKINH